MIKAGINNTKVVEKILLPEVNININDKNYHKISFNDAALEALDFDKETDVIGMANCDNELAFIKVTNFLLEETEGALWATKDDRKKLTKAYSSYHSATDVKDAIEVLGLEAVWESNYKNLDLRAYPITYKVGGIEDMTILVLRLKTDENTEDATLPTDLFGNMEGLGQSTATIEEGITDLDLMAEEVKTVIDTVDKANEIKVETETVKTALELDAEFQQANNTEVQTSSRPTLSTSTEASDPIDYMYTMREAAATGGGITEQINQETPVYNWITEYTITEALESLRQPDTSLNDEDTSEIDEIFNTGNEDEGSNEPF